MFRLLTVAVLSASATIITPPRLATAPGATVSMFKWPPWLSIESPVNPYEPGTRGAVLLARVRFREGVSKVADLSGSAEGLVNGVRQSVPLRFDTTPWPDVYAVRRQWPTQGTWMLRITLVGQTTALVTLDDAGMVASTKVPTRRTSDLDLPRAVAMHEIDSALTVLARGRNVAATR